MPTPAAPTTAPPIDLAPAPALSHPAPPLPAPSPSAPALRPRPASRKRPLLRYAAYAAVGAGIGGAVLFVGWKYGLPLLDGGPADRPLTAPAARTDSLPVTVSERGELESIEAVSVLCELEGGGKLVSILPEGGAVKKGDEVAKLDTDAIAKLLNEQRVKWEAAETKAKTARSEVTQAKSKAGTEVAKAKKTLKLAKIALEAYTDPQGEYTKDLEKLKGGLELARKEQKEAEDDLAFTRTLVGKGFAQLEQVRAKEFGVQQKRFIVASAEAELRVLEIFTKKQKLTELEFNAEDAEREMERTDDAQRSAVEKAEGELKGAENTAAIEKETLTRIQKQIAHCTVRAPSDGIVVYSNSRYWDESSRIRPGATVHNQQEIFSLPDLSRMKVKVKIHEAMVKRVKVGMPAAVTLESLPGRTLNGKVLKIATIAQSDGWRGGGVKQYETEISIDDLPTEAGLKPGMSADVKVLVRAVPDALTVPVSAVAEFDGRRVVYVVDARGRVERREVEVGEANEQFIQVTDHLADGEAVALDARGRAAAELKKAGPAKPGEKKADNPAKPPGAVAAK